MAPVRMTSSDLEGRFCFLKPFCVPELENMARINYDVFVYT